jgi:hypothetical protein
MENRIKECQLDLYADRTSAHTMPANQLRLWFAAMTYGLICALRRIGLAHTQFARASCGATWFWAAFLMATHSNGISALQLRSQLGLGSYRTAWMLCAKLRRVMVNPEREPLCGVVEADETIIPFRTKEDPIVLPAGRSGGR